MSLLTDMIFVQALKSNALLMGKLPAGEPYNTEIMLPDADLDNAPLPQIIVYFDGLTNDQSTKDSFEGMTDTVNIGIEIAAKTRVQLGELAEQVRTTIREYFENITDDNELYDLVPLDYQFSANAVQCIPEKPCFWQTLIYNCDTKV